MTNTKTGGHMPDYTLILKLTPQQLKTFDAKTNIIIAKPTKGETPTVAWQSFQPFEENTVAWEEQYGIYVSSTAVTHGAHLTRMSSTAVPAVEQKLYTLESDAVFSDPPEESTGNPGAFCAENKYGESEALTFGLFQDATVNGKTVHGNALSATSVPHSNIIQMTPHTTVFIWMESDIPSNTVVTEVDSHRTEKTFGGGTTEISLAYDDASGMFI
jgi:hypothetical protein